MRRRTPTNGSPLRLLTAVVVALAALAPAHARTAPADAGTTSAPPSTQGHAGAYSDEVCRSTPVGWTDDLCARRQWGLPRIAAPQAWTVTRGRGATVAIVDTGADFDHPDLMANLVAVPGSNLVENTAYSCPGSPPRANTRTSAAVARDDHGHGTHVAGVAGAVAGNGVGVAGVAPDARILPVKVLDHRGRGALSNVARGICFAVENGANVVNLSLGVDPVASIVVDVGGGEDDFERALGFADERGVAVIVAAGNEAFPACDYPAARASVLCVGATDRNDQKAFYSNFGTNLGVVAPGGAAASQCRSDRDIWSTLLPASSMGCGNEAYETMAGTSMAAPHVAGIAALILSKAPGTPPAEVYAAIKSSADDLGPPGPDLLYGHGRVNAARALAGG